MPSSYSNRICGDVNVVNADFSDDFFRWRASLPSNTRPEHTPCTKREKDTYTYVMMIGSDTIEGLATVSKASQGL